MPIIKIPYGEWTPDVGDLDHSGLFKVSGVVRHARNWFPAPAVVGSNLVGGTAPYNLTELYGTWIHTDTDPTQGTWFYVGTFDRLLRAQNSLTTANATAAAIPTVPDRYSGWQFTSFGNQVWATNYNGHIYSASTPGTNFDNSGLGGGIISSTPTTYRPRARFISTIKNHLLLAHIQFDAAPSGSIPTSALTGTFYPSMVMWSAIDNARRFGDPSAIQNIAVLGSDYQDLTDEHGPITGLIGGDTAYVFKPRAIYFMDGPPWTFRPIVVGAGCTYPNSIVRHYGDVYFWGPSGPTRIRNGQLEILGLGKTSRTLVNLSDTSDINTLLEIDRIAGTSLQNMTASDKTFPIDISAACDYSSGVIAFFGHSITQNTRTVYLRDMPVITFDTNTDEFSFFPINQFFGFARSVPMFGGSVMGGANLYTASKVLDGIYGVYTNGTGAPNTDTVEAAALFGNVGPTVPISYDDTWSPTFEWPYNPIGSDGDSSPITSRITRIRVPYRMMGFAEARAIITVTIRTKERSYSEYHEVVKTYSPTDTYQSSDDWIEFPESVYGKYHKIIVKFAHDDIAKQRDISALTSLRSIEVEYESAGNIGSHYLT